MRPLLVLFEKTVIYYFFNLIYVFFEEMKISSFYNNMLSNKLKVYFENNIKLFLKTEKLFIINKSDVFPQLDIYNDNFSKFIESNDNSIIESMIVKELRHKNIIDLSFDQFDYIAAPIHDQIYCWGNNHFGQLGYKVRSSGENQFLKYSPVFNE
jgi:alpha-tubulin suppressor-like RCC1 family protein